MEYSVVIQQQNWPESQPEMTALSYGALEFAEIQITRQGLEISGNIHGRVAAKNPLQDHRDGDGRPHADARGRKE